MASGVLGDWNANSLFWRSQTALFVNERSLVPVLLPLAPAATVLDRFPAARVAAAIGVSRVVLSAELATMQTHTLAKTASRRVLGVMNDFAYLAEHHRQQHDDVDPGSLHGAGHRPLPNLARQPPTLKETITSFRVR